MAGTVVADNIQAASTSTLVLKNGVANTPPTIQDSAGTQIGTFCRAWVNFNGTTNVGGFCTIRGSFNVTSVADNGTGEYTVNFTTAMPDGNYAVVGSSAVDNVVNRNLRGVNTIGPYNTGNIKINTINATTGSEDQQFINVAVFR